MSVHWPVPPTLEPIKARRAVASFLISSQLRIFAGTMDPVKRCTAQNGVVFRIERHKYTQRRFALCTLDNLSRMRGLEPYWNAPPGVGQGVPVINWGSAQ